MSACERLEDPFHGDEGDLLALQELAERGIVGNTDDVVGDLDGKVEIAERPTETRNGCRSRDQRDFEHGLGLLLDHIVAAFRADERGSMRKGRGEIEAEFLAVGCRGAPATSSQGESFDDHASGGRINDTLRRGLANDFHGKLH